MKQKFISKLILAGRILSVHFYQWATENLTLWLTIFLKTIKFLADGNVFDGGEVGLKKKKQPYD